MDARFIESLESRRFLSADLLGIEPDADQSDGSVLEVDRTPRGSTFTLLGTWRGTVAFDDGDTDALKIKFTRFSDGRYIGKVISLNDPSLLLKIRARFTTGRNFRFTFDGSSDGGVITGQGNATLKPEGDRFVGQMSGSTAGDPFSGTINARFKAPL